ncbi:MAG: DUF1801 domain-containing protein [Flavobacteriales bacterium]|nr:DUF1801 domain-containing protein [Flavobacteriales bacterium]NQX99208.1 DUF1801 domain-containing protein [Flavobacteriales bacterium]
MAENKTQKTKASVEGFINAVDHEGKRKDAFEILAMMKNVTGEEPRMWGGSIIGFGDLHYKSASGREGDWFKCGFSPRKAKISMYVGGCDISKQQEMLDKLGKHKTGKGCLYINKLADVKMEVLKELTKEAYENPQFGS